MFPFITTGFGDSIRDLEHLPDLSQKKADNLINQFTTDLWLNVNVNALLDVKM